MRICLVLPTYITNPERMNWARASFASLAKTVTEGLDAKPMLVFVTPNHPETVNVINQWSYPQFVKHVTRQPGDCHSNDGAFAHTAHMVIKAFPDVTHVANNVDDWLYNPRWLLELQSLIRRRPGARAWWVYRSAFEEIHKTLRIDGDDVLVRSINAGGCVTTQEWKEWGLDYHKCPREDGSSGHLSLDLLHPQQRPGERWVTRKSYILNVGLIGECQRLECPDFAVNFVRG